MLKRLKNKIDRKFASKQPVRYRFDLLVNSLEGLVMDTKEVEISISVSRGGKRSAQKSTSWRLVYPGESRAFFDETLSQPGVTLYKDNKPPFTFEEKEYDIKLVVVHSHSPLSREPKRAPLFSLSLARSVSTSFNARATGRRD